MDEETQNEVERRERLLADLREIAEKAAASIAVRPLETPEEFLYDERGLPG